MSYPIYTLYTLHIQRLLYIYCIYTDSIYCTTPPSTYTIQHFSHTIYPMHMRYIVATIIVVGWARPVWETNVCEYSGSLSHPLNQPCLALGQPAWNHSVESAPLAKLNKHSAIATSNPDGHTDNYAIKLPMALHMHGSLPRTVVRQHTTGHVLW